MFQILPHFTSYVQFKTLTGFNNNNWFLYSTFLVWGTTQSALQCIITPVTGFNINPALIVHLLNSLGSILARCYFRGAHMPHHATNNVRILPGTHLYTWVVCTACIIQDKGVFIQIWDIFCGACSQWEN